jgi:hypothetical protein
MKKTILVFLRLLTEIRFSLIEKQELVDGKWYFNLHTSANPGGEIRGQILRQLRKNRRSGENAR